jgi:chromosome segregation ATPase
MVDAAHQKETLAKETIGTLKGEIQNLSRLIEQGAGMSIGQETAVKELTQVTKELNKERDAQAVQIQQLAKELKGYAARTGAAGEEFKVAQANLQALKEQVRSRRMGRANSVACDLDTRNRVLYARVRVGLVFRT